MIRPILEYGGVIIDNLADNLIDKLESTQRSAALACTGAYRHTDKDKLIKEVGWEPLQIRRKYQRLVLFYKIKKGLTPTYLSNLVNLRELDDNRRRLRNEREIEVPNARIIRYFDSYILKTGRDWNNLDPLFSKANSLDQFKHLLKKTYYYIKNKLYQYGHGPAAINLTRIRLGLSPLKYHLHKIKVAESPICDYCNYEIENPEHYFLNCPLHATARAKLLSSLIEIIPSENISTVNLLTTIIQGHPSLNLETNRQIFEAVFQFIDQTDRFTTNWE